MPGNLDCRELLPAVSTKLNDSLDIEDKLYFHSRLSSTKQGTTGSKTGGEVPIETPKSVFFLDFVV